jgi:predicted outer membrane repeat protein
MTRNTVLREGGAVYATDVGGPTLVNCTLIDNLAETNGGGVACTSDSTVTLQNCILWNNTALRLGDELFLE